MLTPEEIKKMDAITGWSTPVSPSNGGSSRADEIRKIADKAKVEIQGKKDTSSARENLAVFPAKTGPSGDTPLKAGLKSAGNIPSSAFSLGKNVYEAVRHPIDTAKGLGNAAGGAVRAGVEKVTGSQLPDTDVSKDMEDTFGTLSKSLKERYGSLENLQRTATNDPVGFGSDVLSIFTGGAGLAKKVPGVAKALETGAEIVKPITNIAEDANMAARAKIAEKIEGSAQKSIGKVLAPTKETTKAATMKILPQLSERKKFAWTREGLNEKYGAELENASLAIDETLATLDPKAKVQLKPIIDEIEQSKRNFIVKGTEGSPVVANPQAWKAADELQKLVLSVSQDGATAPLESIRSLRQIWDKEVASSKGFLKDTKQGTKLDLTRNASNAIRKELAKEFPDLAKVNAEYTLWKNAEDILGETIKRTTGREATATTKAAGLSGAAAGYVGSGLKTATYLAALGTVLAVTVRSTAWRTLSSIVKSRLADAIATRNVVEIKKILAPIVGEQMLGEINEINNE